MRRPITMVLVAVGVVATLGVGLAVAAIASSVSSSAPASTTSTTETTTPASTTEEGKSIPYAATLSAKAEVPKPSGVRGGAGATFALTLTDKGGTYTAKWKLTFRNLTGKAVAAHIHRGKPGKPGPVLIPLCGPCKPGQGGSARISEAAVTAIKKGQAYVNVHTTKNPGGEIRGQIAKT